MKRVQFSSSFVPYLFLAPQLAVIFIFFYWPSVQAIQSSFYLEDPFGFGASFVGFANYSDAIFNPEYLNIAKFTVVFTVLVTFFSLALGLLLAVKADAVIRGSSTYKTLLISVYAIAPPVAGLIGMMFFDQHIGPFVKMAAFFGWDMKVGLNYFDTSSPCGSRSPIISSSSCPGFRVCPSLCVRRPPSIAAPAFAGSGRSSCRFWRPPPSSC